MNRGAARAAQPRPYAASMVSAAASDEPVHGDEGARAQGSLRQESPQDELAPQDGAGIPDGFQRLWMPHRMAYIKGEGKPMDADEGDGCPFCRIPRLTDSDGLIVARGALVYTVLNLYPYNAGHLMICPYRHVGDYTELDEPETAELASHTKRAMVARGSSRTCTSMLCRGGAGTPTSCPWSVRRGCCPSCWQTRAP